MAGEGKLRHEMRKLGEADRGVNPVFNDMPLHHLETFHDDEEMRGWGKEIEKLLAITES